jgi:alginate O-acetyltransferase complex protein AlgI
MLFCSLEFVVFFAVVFVSYWAIPHHRLRVWLLLAASYYFYASWNKWLALIIFGSTTLDYFVARAIGASASPRARKALVLLSVTANLGLLCYFKYANFFLASLGAALKALGAQASLPVLSVILPIGISFYTFEAINYIVDVYRGIVKPERNLGNFLLFILFFPHLVAGPIVRARDFLPQVRRRKRFSWVRLEVGLGLFLLGLIKKFVIADRMAFYADPVFAQPASYACSVAWLAVVAYSIQIYGDFSGYTDMALGTAHLLGYHLAPNFNMPYLARNVSEFWRRWHISLSSWLRDYLFVPLGGSRGGRWRTARNLMITMALGGLWHGASWNFVLWGLLHGALLVLHRAFTGLCDLRPGLRWALGTLPGACFRVAATYLAVSLGWVLFRSPTAPAAAKFYARLFRTGSPWVEPWATGYLLLGVALCLAGHALAVSGAWRRLRPRAPVPLVGAAYAAAAAAALLLAPAASKAFIYFQF